MYGTICIRPLLCLSVSVCVTFSLTLQAAHQLARIAQHHGFDGWLINIENTLSPSLIPNVLHFLTHLREKMRSLCGPHAHLIW